MMEYNNVTLKKTIKMLRQNAERIPGLVFTGAGPPILLCRVKAMAAETPVISSNAGGIPEVNIQGETGFLAEVGNVEAMASYAIKLLSDDKLLAEIKKKAKARALEFDLVNILPIYEKMYEETLAEFHKMA